MLATGNHRRDQVARRGRGRRPPSQGRAASVRPWAPSRRTRGDGTRSIAAGRESNSSPYGLMPRRSGLSSASSCRIDRRPHTDGSRRSTASRSGDLSRRSRLRPAPTASELDSRDVLDEAADVRYRPERVSDAAAQLSGRRFEVVVFRRPVDICISQFVDSVIGKSLGIGHQDVDPAVQVQSKRRRHMSVLHPASMPGRSSRLMAATAPAVYRHASARSRNGIRRDGTTARTLRLL